ncbi:hypothetical protein F2Q68_00036869 [Brassica cretica]|uniref:C2H2-type domain-containing protein n=1 Tax=Brassica cretica TaxID=69181 RepID=A0A8S9H6S9_BRACR|nr:hypothetical protein F2Q68_00036869 [Brassica cretica]
MVAGSESFDRTVEDTTTNCLMLLSRVGECGGGDAESRVFRCRTCMKEFSSFQALGVHRVSHRKPISNSSGEEQSLLGGHMRKHWNKEDSGGALVTRSFFPEAAMARTLKEKSKGFWNWARIR